MEEASIIVSDFLNYLKIYRANAEDECSRFENRIKELHLEKESVVKECTEIRAALSLAEDKYDNTYAQLQETIRKLKECKWQYWMFFFNLGAVFFLFVCSLNT